MKVMCQYPALHLLDDESAWDAEALRLERKFPAPPAEEFQSEFWDDSELSDTSPDVGGAEEARDRQRCGAGIL